MLKKKLLFIAGILILATISLCNNNYPSRQICSEVNKLDYFYSVT